MEENIKIIENCISSDNPVLIFDDETDISIVTKYTYQACIYVPVTSNKDFIESLKTIKDINRATFIICFGGSYADKLSINFDELYIKNYCCNIAGDFENLELFEKKKKDWLEERIQKCISDPEGFEKMQDSAFDGMCNFLMKIEDHKASRFCYKTGFSNLDELLGGGLYAGLITLGGISSIGKTTFILQLADQIAKNGNDVLYYSLEMARDELLSKSLSRISFEKSLEKNSGNTYAQTPLNILNGKFLESENYTKHIVECGEEYLKYAGNIYFKIGNFKCGLDEIKRDVKKHIERKGKKPLLIVDYLQIMTPSKDCKSYTDKQIVDDAVKGLKVLSRNYEIPIIVVSALNRASYTDPVSMAAFKESGAIEYTADVLLGIQYKGMDYEDESDKERKARIQELIEDQEEKAKTPGLFNEVEVKIMKNRNGAKGTKAYFEYSQMFSYFRPLETKKINYNF